MQLMSGGTNRPIRNTLKTAAPKLVTNDSTLHRNIYLNTLQLVLSLKNFAHDTLKVVVLLM